jgi:hypothetical protein
LPVAATSQPNRDLRARCDRAATGVRSDGRRVTP